MSNGALALPAHKETPEQKRENQIARIDSRERERRSAIQGILAERVAFERQRNARGAQGVTDCTRGAR